MTFFYEGRIRGVIDNVRVIALASLCVLSGCTSESGAWHGAQERDTANAYCSFAARYPDSEHSHEAQQGRDEAISRALHESLRQFSVEDNNEARRALETAQECDDPLVLNNLAVLAVIDENFDQAQRLLEEASELSDNSEVGDTVVFFVLAGRGGEGVVSVAALSTPGFDVRDLDIFEPAPGGTFFPIDSVVTANFSDWIDMSNIQGRTVLAVIEANLRDIS